jgi:uncharacterized protein (TIGR00369 family)
MGVEFTEATADRVVAELEVGPHHLQHFGLVHGGVYCGVIESAASLGAFLAVHPEGRSVVGMENQTSFLRAVREGRLRVVATPVHKGHNTQLWEATVTDGEGRVVATGRVRLLCIDKAAPGSG